MPRALPNAGLERIKQTRAVLYEPAGETDLPQKFTAGLVLAITLDAEIESVQDIRNVRVKVSAQKQGREMPGNLVSLETIK